MNRIHRIAASMAAAGALALAPLALTPPEAEAMTFIFKVSARSTRPVVVYENHYCKGDSDSVWPGEYENSSALKTTASVWVSTQTGIRLNGIPRKSKGSPGVCINIWGVYGTVIADTW